MAWGTVRRMKEYFITHCGVYNKDIMGPHSQLSIEMGKYPALGGWFPALILQLYAGVPFAFMMAYSSLIIPVLVDRNPDLKSDVYAKTQTLFVEHGKFSAAQQFVGLYMHAKDKMAAEVAAGVSKAIKKYQVNYSVLIAMYYSGIYNEELMRYAPELMSAHIRAWLSFENQYISLFEQNNDEGVSRGSQALLESADHVQLIASLANWIDLTYIVSGRSSISSSGSSSGSGSGSSSESSDHLQHVHTELLRGLVEGMRVLLGGDKQEVADLLCQATFLKGTRHHLQKMSWEDHTDVVAAAVNLAWTGKAKCFKAKPVCCKRTQPPSEGMELSYWLAAQNAAQIGGMGPDTFFQHAVDAVRAFAAAPNLHPKLHWLPKDYRAQFTKLLLRAQGLCVRS